MKAVIADGPGGPETLRLAEIETPREGSGELLIRVRACALNPVDYKIRKGYFSQGRVYPAIYGYDVSGVVERATEGAPFQTGEEVFYWSDLWGQGAYAEYQTIDAARVARKPERLSHVEAAALPVAGVTAWQGLIERARCAFGETVLIMGAAGGVGSLAVQVAAWRGITVIGVCSASNVAYVRDLGADHVIDYGAANVVDEVMSLTDGRGADAAFDLVGGEAFAECVRALAPFGRLVFLNAIPDGDTTAIAAINAARPKNLSIHCHIIHPEGDAMSGVTRLAERGHLAPQVDQVIPLSRVADGHRRLETMHGRGKIVIDMSLEG